MSFFLDALYPARCVACGTPGREDRELGWWCMACRQAVERVPQDPCPRCFAIEPSHNADVCDGSLPFHGVVVTGFYHSLPLRRLIADVKYQGVTATGAAVQAYARDARRLRHEPFPWAHEASLAVIPMPLANARERQRGFNQAAWVAERLCAAWDIHDVLPRGAASRTLLRQKTTTAQAELGHNTALRTANIHGAFQAVGSMTFPVLLIDDVITTGATAAEAARALLAAGAPRVYLAGLALGK